MADASPKPYSPSQIKFTRRLVLPVMSKLNTAVYRVSKGRIGGRFPGGAPVLLLTTTGRRSGQPRTAPLLYLEDGDRYVVVASQGGLPTNPDWFHNLSADPAVAVEIKGRREQRRARVASPEEKAALWPRLNAMYGNYATYQARATNRDIPVVLLERP